MQTKTFRSLAAAICCAAGLTVSVSAGSGVTAGGSVSRPVAQARFQAENPSVQVARTGAAVTTISHAAFSFGATPEESANAFLANHVGLFGVNLADLVPGSLAGDGAPSRQVMPVDGAGEAYKFTLLSYLQTKDGIPVYRGDLRLLVRNEAGSPLVLARSGIKDLGDFAVNGAMKPNVQAALDEAALRFPGAHSMTAPQVVIYAGDEANPVAASLAVVFELNVGQTGEANYARWRVVADASTGKTIAVENLIHNVDVSGNISAQVTTGFKSAECNPEALTALPFARASIGATSVFADANGNFTIPNAGSTAVTVVGSLQGRWFSVFNPSALAPTVSGSFTPPGPANLVLNSANTDEFRRAEANSYYFANTVRSFALASSPSFPTIGTQLAFRVNTAVSGTCNAFYDGSSINFYNNGGGCANTAYSDVVFHEYGHHLVNVGGSGQGQYGEGMGDCMGIILTDQPILGFGFQNNCAAGIRTAANTYQYPQNGEIHDAGQLISGCVWSLRNQLVVTEPSNYKTILGQLTVNSILLHDGTQIEPSIYTDFLTLDDNDANLGNGTPHYCEINAAFAAHSMATAGGAIGFSFPGGQPSFVSPNGGAGSVQVTGLCATITPGTARVFIDKENDGTYVQSTMTDSGGGLYTFNFPASTCGSTVRYYFSANTSTGTVFSPTGAPTAFYTTASGYGLNTVFTDTFQTNLGWTTSVSGATTGAWERAVPSAANTFGAAPVADADGSGFCFITQNAAGTSIGDFDIDGGTVTLTSPTLNATGASFVSYSRWFSNNLGAGADDDTFTVQVSGNNGTTWQNLEVVGPNGGAEQHGGWFAKKFGVPAAAATAQFKIRFTTGETGPAGSIVEAAVDAIKLEVVDCDAPTCPPDFDGDGFLTGDDFDAFVAAFEAGNISADFDGNGFVTGEDFDAYVVAFEAGC